MSKKKKDKNEIVDFELMVQEINGFAKQTRVNRFHQVDNPVKLLTKQPEKEQKVDENSDSNKDK